MSAGWRLAAPLGPTQRSVAKQLPPEIRQVVVLWGCKQQGEGSRGCAGLSVAARSRHFQTSHHPTYGSCYTFDGIWATQCPGITHGECRPRPGMGGGVQASMASPWASPRDQPGPQD